MHLNFAATEDNPFSVCAFCTDSHAGVRFMALPNSPFLDEINSLKMSFECSIAGENVVSV